MPLVTGAYCGLEDLRKGDLPLPAYMGDGTNYVKGAAEEIDAALGQIYETPFNVGAGTNMERPGILTLKKVNWLLASGRLILDLAASGEDANLHAYGKQMLDEGLLMLAQLASGEMVLVGAETPASEDPDVDPSPTGPFVLNEDAESLVQSFYDRHNYYTPLRLDSPDPYAGTR